MRSARFVAWSFALLLAVPSIASAQTDPARRDAEARFHEGLTRVQSGDFDAARLAFVQAYAVLKSTDVLWNLALSEHKSNHPLDALGHFKEYVRDARTSEPDRAKARKYIEEIYARIGRISVDSPSGVTILVDGRVLPQLTPLPEPIDVAPGEHFVEARVGDRSRNMRVNAPAGSVVSVHVRGDELGLTGAAAVATGPADSGANPGTPVEPPREEHADNTTRNIVAGTFFGAAAVSLAGTIVFAVMASSKNSDAEAILPGTSNNACVGANALSVECTTLNDTRTTQAHDVNWARGLGITTGVLAVGGVATLLLWPHTTHDSHAHGKTNTGANGVRLIPLFGATNGAALTTTF